VNYIVHIQVRGHLDQDWSDWMGELQIVHPDAHTTQLSGQLPDQPALYGVLSRLAALNLELIGVWCAPVPEADAPAAREC
jgi:hypothetical protein